MQHHGITVNEFQRQNLIRLATHLNYEVTNLEFDMVHYSDAETPSECGSVGCAVGHGPSIGISARENETWSSYTERCFIDSKLNRAGAWCWAFSPVWADVDNTSRGAAARIFYMLEHGVPENYIEQSLGEGQLSYSVAPFVEFENKLKKFEKELT